MDPEKWESIESLNKNSGVMVSNLPLLFARGYPSSLEKMNHAELEAFVPFMVRCSSSEDLKTSWSDLPRPPWWPTKLPFRVPSNKTILIKIVQRCYAFHGCEYLLQFCTSLVISQPEGGYRFTDNRDGTSSMYDGTTGKLLVTFRNENREYDKLILHRNQGQKKLLPKNGPKNGAMVQKAVSDVYLCDKCDDEFNSLKEVQIHEKQCQGDRPDSPKLPSPEPEILEDEKEAGEQVPFLSYLGLQPSQHTGIEPYKSPRKKSSYFFQEKKPFGSNYTRYETIDIGSPLGRFIISKSRFGGRFQLPQSNVLKYERHVYACPESDSVILRESSRSTTNRWMTVWRPNKDLPPFQHLYCFNKQQTAERMKSIDTGLDSRSRKLLKRCKGVKVKLKRLAKRTIDRVSRLGHRRAPCIDLTSPDEGPSLIMCDPLGLNSPSKPCPPSAFPQYQSVNGMLVPGTILTADPLAADQETIDHLSSFGCTVRYKDSIGESAKRPNSLPLLLSPKRLKVEPVHTNHYSPPSQIEVIDLSSDDESLPSSPRSCAQSKNGCSHWSPREQHLRPDARRSSSVTNGSTPSRVTHSCSPHPHLSKGKNGAHKLTDKYCNKIKFRTTEDVPIKDSRVLLSRLDPQKLQTASIPVDDEISLNWCFQEGSSGGKPSETNFMQNLATKFNQSINFLKHIVETSLYQSLPISEKEKVTSQSQSAINENNNIGVESKTLVEDDSLKYFPQDYEALKNTFTHRTESESTEVSNKTVALGRFYADEEVSFKEDSFSSNEDVVFTDENSNSSISSLMPPFRTSFEPSQFYSSIKKEPEPPHSLFAREPEQPSTSLQPSLDKKRMKYLSMDKVKFRKHLDDHQNSSLEKKSVPSGKKRRLTKELASLGRDECKELKGLGFHPTDIVGDSDRLNNNDELTPPEEFPHKSSLISYKRLSPSKKTDDNLSSQESVQDMMRGNKKMTRELKKLMSDEWKEFKKSGSHPSQLPGLFSTRRSLRSIKEHGNKSRFISKDLSQLESDKDWSLVRNTRGQARGPPVVIETPRTVHRGLIESQKGMCVVNYEYHF